jgi:hypothetical protein
MLTCVRAISLGWAWQHGPRWSAWKGKGAPAVKPGPVEGRKSALGRELSSNEGSCWSMDGAGWRRISGGCHSSMTAQKHAPSAMP